MSRVLSAMGLVLASTIVSGSMLRPARADEPDAKARCASAYEGTQRQRKAGKLREARKQATECRRAECPAFIVKDCAHWIDEIDALMPSVVISATNSHDKDVTDVAVFVDDEPLMDHLTGLAVNVDPGRHKFRFEREDEQPVEKTVLIQEGEKARVLRVHFTAPGQPDRDQETPAPDQPAQKPETVDRTPVYLLGGAGVVALGAFAYFAATGVSDENDARSTCAPDCPPSRVDGIKRKYTYADISLGLGVACVGIATYLLIHDSGSSPPPASAPAQEEGLRLDVAPTAHGAVGALSGRF